MPKVCELTKQQVWEKKRLLSVTWNAQKKLWRQFRRCRDLAEECDKALVEMHSFAEKTAQTLRYEWEDQPKDWQESDAGQEADARITKWEEFSSEERLIGVAGLDMRSGPDFVEFGQLPELEGQSELVVFERGTKMVCAAATE